MNFRFEILDFRLRYWGLADNFGFEILDFGLDFNLKSQIQNLKFLVPSDVPVLAPVLAANLHHHF